MTNSWTKDEFWRFESEEIANSIARVVLSLTSDDRLSPLSEIGGFAICTDASLTNLFVRAATKEWMGAAGRFEFWIGDWPIDVDAEGFDEPAERLELRYRDYLKIAPRNQMGEPSMEPYLRRAFEAFVRSLEIVRESGVFSPTTVLFANSTDPAGLVLELATDSVQRLNSADVCERWRRSWQRG